MQGLRVVRLLLPIELVRRMDELLAANTAGYQTRHEFAKDALEAMILELTYGTVPDEPTFVQATPTKPQTIAAPEAPAVDLAATVLHPAPRGLAIGRGMAVVQSEPMFGLHNRDYPSIWAAHFLAGITANGPVPAGRFFEEVTREAWRFGEALGALGERGGVKLSALFPKNRANPQAAEDVFRTFAVGGFNRKSGGVTSWGPLFAWRVCDLDEAGGDLVIGLTEHGYQLLEELDGLSLRLPHPPELADRFFGHLQRFTPEDWWGFAEVLRSVAREPKREEMVADFLKERPMWKEKQAATYAAGYLARAREWGLVAQKQVKGRYAPTEFGKAWAEKIRGGK
jgi:hypothetical protein